MPSPPAIRPSRLKSEGNRRKADVIPATAFHRYYKFNGVYDQNYVEGICFWDKSGERIANYPNQHCTNLTKKHQSSGERLKPTIRMMKNLRRKLVDDGLLEAGRAPSYYIEGLLYNVPDDKVTGLPGGHFLQCHQLASTGSRQDAACNRQRTILFAPRKRKNLLEAHGRRGFYQCRYRDVEKLVVRFE